LRLRQGEKLDSELHNQAITFSTAATWEHGGWIREVVGLVGVEVVEEHLGKHR